MDDYRDIMNAQRPQHIDDDFSVRHPKMQTGDRAKIFAPFAALKGHSETVKENERQTTTKKVLSPEQKDALSFILQDIDQLLCTEDFVTVNITYFIPDGERTGEGIYKTEKMNVKKVDTDFFNIISKEKTISFDNIYKILIL